MEWGRSCAPRAHRLGTSAAAAGASLPRRACGSTGAASPSGRRSWQSSAKSRRSAEKSAGSSAGPVKRSGMTELVPVRRALISLSDKSGLDELAAGLARHGVEIISTGGTAAKLRELGGG